MGARQSIARRTPGWLRKAIRMGEHYGRRQAAWLAVLREMRGVSRKDRAVMARSLVAAPLTALRRLDGFQYPVVLHDVDVDVKGVGRFHIRAGTDDIIHVMTAREPAERRAVERLLQPGDTFVDAGANIGFYSVLAFRQVGASGRIVAFEMMPPTAARLRAHLSENQVTCATVIERALSDRSGDVITATSNPEKLGQASIVVNDAAHGRSLRYDVPTITLDEALADVGPIALIKMDVEGAEPLALAGATAVLARTRAIIFESNDKDPRVFGLLQERGFAIEWLGGNDYIGTRDARGEA